MTTSLCLLLEVANVRIASRCMRISAPLLRPSRSNTLRDDLWASSVIPLSCDLAMAPGLIVRPDAVLSWGRDGPASSRLLLSVVADLLDSAYERETCFELARWFEVALPHVVVLATCCSSRDPLIADLNLCVRCIGRSTILSSSCLMVWTTWSVSSTIPSSCACWLAT